MSGLSESEREALTEVFEARRAGARSDDLNIFAAIEQIIAARVDLAVHLAEEAVRAETLELVDARVTAALTEAAERLEEVARTPRMWMAYPEAARIVRAATPADPASPADPLVR